MRQEEKERITRRLIDEYGNHILRLCCLYVKDHHLAEDLTQETFIKVYQNLEHFKGESSEKTWITRIAINQCKNAMHKNWFYRERGSLPDDGSAADPNDPFVRTENSMLIVSEIRKLPPKIREVIILYYYEELSVREIGELLQVKENTVLSRLKRGRDCLKKQIKEDI